MKKILITISSILCILLSNCSSDPSVQNGTGGAGSGGIGISTGGVFEPIACETHQECPGNQLCREGFCSNSNIDIPIPMGGSTGDGGASVCASVDVQFEKEIPTVALMIDRSGSMLFDDFPPTRWEAVGYALFNDTNGVILELQDEVNFGLAMFNSNGGDEGGECPVLVTTDPALESYDVTKELFESSAPQNIEDTPTGDSIDWIIDNFKFSESGPNIIVLATDGEPDTCEIPNPNDPVRNPAGRAESEAAVALAFANGIRTYVISVGNDIGVEHLEDLANIGVGKDKDDPDQEPVYVATSSDSLIDSFNAIVNGTRSCVLGLDGNIADGHEGDGKVTIDGVQIDQGDNGYIVIDESTIELVGDSCELIKSGDHEIGVEFPCESFEPIQR